MKTILQQGILPKDQPTTRWIGECNICKAIYSGTDADIAKRFDDGSSGVDRACNFCGQDNSVSYYLMGTSTADEILAKVRK